MYKYLLTTSIHHSSNKEVCMKDLSVFIQFIINIVLNYTFSYLGTLENHSPQPGISHLKSALQSNKTSFINTRTIKTLHVQYTMHNLHKIWRCSTWKVKTCLWIRLSTSSLLSNCCLNTLQNNSPSYGTNNNWNNAQCCWTSLNSHNFKMLHFF